MAKSSIEIAVTVDVAMLGAIVVWRFEDAPERFRSLSTNGGDEDWLAFVPSGFPGGVPFWMGDSADGGWCNIVDWYDVEGGSVCIGSHS